MDRELTVYQKKLTSPKWQKKRLQILQRDNFKCRACGDTESELHVHHIYYHPLNINSWDYSDYLLITLCDSCHKKEHELDLQYLAEWYFKSLLALTNSCLINMYDLQQAICDESPDGYYIDLFKVELLKIIKGS
jgi:5-methylcytosine-specific restriction endonuclease McrA